MKTYLKIFVLFALSFSLYGCPNAEGDKTETNTVDLAMNDSEVNNHDIEKQEKE